MIKNGKLDFYSEQFINDSDKHGNIYVGRIARIEPSLKCVFVDFGSKKYGFLRQDSIHPMYFTKLSHEERQIVTEEILKSTKQASLKQNDTYNNYNLKDLLNINDKIFVQIIRSEHENKSVMLSTYLSVKGRYFKYIINSLESKLMFHVPALRHEEQQLHENFIKIFNNQGTLSLLFKNNLNLPELLQDMNDLHTKYDYIFDNKSKIGSLLYFEENDILKILKNNKIIEIIIEEDSNYIKSLIELHRTDLIHRNGFNIFKDFEVQINSLSQNTIILSCGGSIIIEKTSLGHTIDVNLSKNLCHNNYQASILETNINAVEEIFRQIRLRNLSGMIIVDFISMNLPDDIMHINDLILKYIQKDPAKIAYTNMSKFCIIEMSRQYMSLNLKLNSIESIVEKIIRYLYYLSEEMNYVELHASAMIIEYIINNTKQDLIILETKLNMKVQILIVENMESLYFKIFSATGEVQLDQYFSNL